MFSTKQAVAVFALVCTVAAGAFAKKGTTRVDSNEVVDLDGFWNDSDVKIVCDDLIAQCIASPRVARFEDDNGRPATVIIGKISNKSSEYIDTTIVTKRFQNAIINSGVLEFVSDSSERQALRSEKLDQDIHSSEESAKSIDNELAADFMLLGEVNSIVQTSGKTQVRTYFVTIQLHDLETNPSSSQVRTAKSKR